MFAGMKITIEGQEYLVPALSLGQLRTGLLDKIKEHDALVAEGKTFDVMVLRGEIILAALKRNYPDFDEAKLMSYLDMSNVRDLWLHILGASGFSPGETVAATANGT
jgi:hypothetical protein